MKKLSILLIGLLLVTGFAFAQEVTVKGDATITFGLDLNTNTVGFKNAASSSIELKWFDKVTSSSGAEGWITLKDWNIEFDSEDKLDVHAPSVSAGWMFDPVKITIYSAPSMKIGNANGFIWHIDAEADVEDDDDEVTAALSGKNVATAAGAATDAPDIVMVPAGDPAPTGGVFIGTDGTYDFYAVAVTTAGAAAVATSYAGLTAAIDLGVATLTLKVASDGDWTTSDNDFAIGAEVSAAVGPANVKAGVYAGPFDSMDLGFSVGADAMVGPATVDVGFDGFKADGATDLDYDVSVDISAAVAGITLGSTTYLWSAGGADMEMDQEVTLDATGVVEGLGLTETFQMINVLGGAAEWWSKTSVSYTTGGIKPFAAFEIDDASIIDVEAGVELSGFVENTVFTLKYDVDDVSDTNKGVVTFAGKIKF
jgi:hypothetical protein